MGQVNIRGLVNTTYLREGERATVEHTDTIDQLAKNGLIAIERLSNAERLALGDNRVRGKFEQLRRGDLDTGERGFAKGGFVPRPMAPPEPRRGASKAKWVDWLTLNGIAVSDDDTKNDLIEKWMGRAI